MRVAGNSPVPEVRSAWAESSQAKWPRRFQGAYAVVFGGASGIGAATVERLRAEGARVLVADLSRPTGMRDDDFVACDLRQEQSIAAAFATFADGRTALDLVVNTVGVVLDGAAGDTGTDDWHRLVDVNLTGAFLVTRAALSVLSSHAGASVTHVASDAGLVGWPRQAAYCASKGGLVHFVRSAALDAAPAGIRVNCVCPSFTATPLVERWLASTDDPEATRSGIEAMQPLGRMAQPNEIAAGIAWLASREASHVTGIALPIDGGVVAQ